MKFTSVIVLSLGLFIASCSAACDCKANDQSCLNKCGKVNGFFPSFLVVT